MKYNEILEEARDSVGKGWWPILDKYLPQIVELAPDCDIIVKEKYGTLHIQTYGKGLDWDKLSKLEMAAEQESATVCEECGQPGKLHPEFYWRLTLCDRCAAEHHKRTLDLPRLSTGIRASNGEMCEGDTVRFDNGMTCFTTKIVYQNGVFGFFIDDEFCSLQDFIRDFTIFQKEGEPGAEIDFEIIKGE